MIIKARITERCIVLLCEGTFDNYALMSRIIRNNDTDYGAGVFAGGNGEGGADGGKTLVDIGESEVRLAERVIDAFFS